MRNKPTTRRIKTERKVWIGGRCFKCRDYVVCRVDVAKEQAKKLKKGINNE